MDTAMTLWDYQIAYQVTGFMTFKQCRGLYLAGPLKDNGLGSFGMVTAMTLKDFVAVAQVPWFMTLKDNVGAGLLVSEVPWFMTLNENVGAGLFVCQYLWCPGL